MTVEANDLQTIAQGRLVAQYADSPNLGAVVTLLVGCAVEARDAALTLPPMRTIDGAEGDGLDGLGQILGQPRELSGTIPLDFFALHDGLGGPASEGLGDLGDASAGMRFRSINESPSANSLLLDAEYRDMQRAKILRNQTAAYPEDIIESVMAVLGDGVAVVLTFGITAVTATVQRVLSTEEISLLNAMGGLRGNIPVIPRPAGVELTVAGL